MIRFILSLGNPWCSDNFQNLYNSAKRISTHKAVEFEVLRCSSYLAEFDFSWTVHTDHAGVSLTLGLFGYSICASFYDIRHWDCDKRKWIEHVH